MKGYEFVHWMTLEEWKQFAKNYDPKFGSHKACSLKKYLKNTEFAVFRQFICWAFSWERSPEGHVYWDKICERKKPIVLSDEKVKLPKK